MDTDMNRDERHYEFLIRRYARALRDRSEGKPRAHTLRMIDLHLLRVERRLSEMQIAKFRKRVRRGDFDP